MNTANILDIINSAILPLAAVAASAHFSVAVSFFVLATATVLWTALVARPLWQEIWIAMHARYSSTLTKALLKYGLPRIPGDFALAGMVLGAPWLVAQHSNLSEVGHFAIAQTLLIVPGAGLAALAIVLLPYVSERLAVGDIQAVKNNSVRLFHAVIDNSIYFCLHVSIMADHIVGLWVGQSMLGASSLVRILMFSVPFYTTYFVFRSVLDASTTRPITTINLVMAFGVFAICYYLLMQIKISAAVAAAISLSAGYLVLGLLTFIALIKFYGTGGFFDKKTLKMLIFNCIIAAGILAPRLLLELSDVTYFSFEALALCLYGVIAVKARREWAVSLLRKLHYGR
jgi:O-antigen/teichoic acid export membrane protein